MKTTGRIVLLCGFFLAGCGAAPVKVERHAIFEIPRLDVKGTSMYQGAGATQQAPNSTASSETATSESKAVRGVWLSRTVYCDQQDWTPCAIEILFCPAGKDDFTKCRIGVGWSKTRPRLGNEVKKASSW